MHIDTVKYLIKLHRTALQNSASPDLRSSSISLATHKYMASAARTTHSFSTTSATSNVTRLSNIEAKDMFDRFCCDILDLADDITRSNISEDIINFPHVIAAGDQSSGKSSVLGILSGVKLPTGEGRAVTKCAVQLVMRKKDTISQSMMYPRYRPLLDISQITDEIEKFQNEREMESFELSEMPSFRIEGPETKNLTVVDLPGIFHSTTRNQATSLPQEVQETVKRYIQNPKCLILGVVDCTKDLALNTLFELLREVDSEDARTIIVFTKLDKLQGNDQRVRQLIEEVKHGRQIHNFSNYVYVNSVVDTVEDESNFFNDICSRFDVSADLCGFDNLYLKVCSMLMDPIYSEFHHKWPQIERHFEGLSAKCRVLENTINNPESIVNRKLTQFIEQSRNALKCVYTNEGRHNNNGDDAHRLYSVYRKYFKEFNDEYTHAMEDFQLSLQELATDGRQQEMRGFSNWAAFKNVAVPIVTSFQEPAAKCQQKTLKKNKEIVYGFISSHFADHPRHFEFLRTKVDEIFDKQNSVLNRQLERVYECEKYLHVDDELQEKLEHTTDQNHVQAIPTAMQNGDFSEIISSAFQIIRPFAAPMVSTIQRYFWLTFIAVAFLSVALLFLNSALNDTIVGTILSPILYIANWTLYGVIQMVAVISIFYFLFSRMILYVQSRHMINISNLNTATTDRYARALELVKKLAVERLANVIPSNILLCLNEEAQQEIQTIDRYHVEFSQLEWETSEEEIRLNHYHELLEKFEEWSVRRQNIIEKHRMCNRLIAPQHA